MTTPVLTFFNNKGGVGKTSLVYHLAWMFSELGKTIVAVDLDPQANLTAAFIDEEELERLWNAALQGPPPFTAASSRSRKLPTFSRLDWRHFHDILVPEVKFTIRDDWMPGLQRPQRIEPGVGLSSIAT